MIHPCWQFWYLDDRKFFGTPSQKWSTIATIPWKCAHLLVEALPHFRELISWNLLLYRISSLHAYRTLLSLGWEEGDPKSRGTHHWVQRWAYRTMCPNLPDDSFWGHRDQGIPTRGKCCHQWLWNVSDRRACPWQCWGWKSQQWLSTSWNLHPKRVRPIQPWLVC